MPGLPTRSNASIFVRRPIRHNGSDEDPKVKFTCVVLAHYHKAWNSTRDEVLNNNTSGTQLVNFTSSSQKKCSSKKLTIAKFGIFLEDDKDYLSLRWGPGRGVNCKAHVFYMVIKQLYTFIFDTLLGY